VAADGRPHWLGCVGGPIGPAGHDYSDDRSRLSQADVPQVSVSELRAALAGRTTVIDVREPDEWIAARVPGVVLVPLAELPLRLDELPSNGPIYLICATGNRSNRAAEFLRARGLDGINVAGGTTGWVEAGYEVESGPATG
jgi:rhodanese-related sulfurtransferase